MANIDTSTIEGFDNMTADEKVTALLGIQVPMNAAFFLGIIFILCMLIGMTIIVSGLKNKIYRLTQVIALLEKRIEGLENKEETHEEE